MAYLYPNSKIEDVVRPKYEQAVEYRNLPDVKEAFTGYIPIESLKIQYLPGSGPGEDTLLVKIKTLVKVGFSVNDAEWIPNWIKPKLIEMFPDKITRDGWMIVECDKTRKQLVNKAECLDSIRFMIRQAEKQAMVEDVTDTFQQFKILRKQKAHKPDLVEPDEEDDDIGPQIKALKEAKLEELKESKKEILVTRRGRRKT